MQEKESKKPTSKRAKKPIAKKEPSKGLGDTVAKITKATGIKKVVEMFANGQDCGCDKRQEKLNKLFPYERHKPAKCLSEDNYNDWTNVKDIPKSERSKYINEVYPVIAQVHAEVFDHKFHKPCTCSPKQWDNWRQDIEKLYSTYDK